MLYPTHSLTGIILVKDCTMIETPVLSFTYFFIFYQTQIFHFASRASPSVFHPFSFPLKMAAVIGQDLF